MSMKEDIRDIRIKQDQIEGQALETEVKLTKKYDDMAKKVGNFEKKLREMEKRRKQRKWREKKWSIYVSLHIY